MALAIFFMSISTLGMATTLVFSSSHWLLAWMGLEMSTLAIIPLMIKQYHPRAVEATTKYFIVQATGATLILFSAIINAWTFNQWDISLTSLPFSALITVALALKLGLAPLHFWLPEVLQGVTLTVGLVLSTWQKLPPLALLLQLPHDSNYYIILALGMSSTLLGGLSGINQTQVRKIMAYSSIAHMGWIIIIAKFLPVLATLAIIIYLVLTATTFLILKVISSTSISSLTQVAMKTPQLTSILMLALLSLSGLPPLSGFMPKWLILDELSKHHIFSSSTILAITTLLSLFFYLRLCYTLTITTSPSVAKIPTLWFIPKVKTRMYLTLLISMTISLLPLTPLLAPLMY
uniref:NADH-ubiquinone oxidoreductase chain 2 n=1 Tax=Danionella mirifica TaxID=487619 RepID=F3Y6Z7_9TELE|nr:NADH dehydrogenase subunit 2 [Danionella mirifica]